MKGLREISERIRESITRFIEAAEGSEPLLDRVILDMKKRINEAKDLVATAIVEEERLKRVYKEAIAAARGAAKRADIAARNGNVIHARAAREQHQYQLHRADAYKRQIEAQVEIIARLKRTLHEFYQRFRSTAQRAAELQERQKWVETYTKLYEVLSDEIIDSKLAKGFERAEQKLESTEIYVKMSENEGHPTATETETIEQHFDLDQALAKLKEEVLDSRRK